MKVVCVHDDEDQGLCYVVKVVSSCLRTIFSCWCYTVFYYLRGLLDLNPTFEFLVLTIDMLVALLDLV